MISKPHPPLCYYDFFLIHDLISSVNPLHVLGVDDNLSDEEETAPEKRLRLAKEYLAELEEQGLKTSQSGFLHVHNFFLLTERDDKDTVDYDAIAHRLKDEVVCVTIYRTLPV